MSRYARTLVVVAGLAVGALAGCQAPGSGPAVPSAGGKVGDLGGLAAGPSVGDPDEFLLVDCLLPARVKRLGRQLTYLSARQPIRTSGIDCEIRGGEYVAYDRADYRTALAVWQAAAEEGDPKAQTYVGEIYEKGPGGTPDYAAAAQWYRLAADQDYAPAQINLGQLYELGWGVPRDQVTALNWYRRASGFDTAGLTYVVATDVAGELEGLRAQVVTGAGEAARLRREIGELQSRLGQLQAGRPEIAAPAAADLAGDRAEIEQARDQLAQLREELAAERAALASERELAGRASEDLARHKAAVMAHVADLEAHGAQVSARKTLVQDRAAEVAAREARIADLESDLAMREARLDEEEAAVTAREARIGQLEAEVAARAARLRDQEAELRDQAGQVAEREARVESQEAEIADRVARLDDRSRLDQEIAQLNQAIEAKRRQLEGLNRQAEVALAGPTITMLEPPLPPTRGLPVIRTRAGLDGRPLVGRVDAPAGLLSLLVNERAPEFNERYIFRTSVPVPPTGVEVDVTAIDNQGKQGELSFVLQPESEPSPPAEVAPAAGPGRAALRIPPIDFGRYHALVIGNDRYPHLPFLDTAVADAEAIADLLAMKYGFEVTLLRDANRYQILSALNAYRANLTSEDNLLIYYAGHGVLDQLNQRGHWLPVDAEPDNTANWISNADITDILNAVAAKRVLVIADSCYSGALTRASLTRLEPGLTESEWIARLRALEGKRSRTALTSGGLQPTLDSGGGQNSVFAKALLDVLAENDGLIEGQRVHQQVQARVTWAAEQVRFEQVPEYAPIRFAGHEGGEFFFVPRL